MPAVPPTLASLATEFAAGHARASALIDEALARIADPAGEGGRAFIRVYGERARAEAAASDRLRANGVAPGPLAGVPVSIKDLFDVAGEPTTAGSIVLAGAAPAEADAVVVRRLRQAGAVIVGKTNMTEFAYSGLGINPHYGTPANPWDPERIPGGSSSGAGVAGPYGFAVASIGTDTGGSVRVPAAFCRLVGFKPTSRRVPLDGVLPLSPTLDSVGPLAASVACCAVLDAVMAGEDPTPPMPLPVRHLRLAVPKGSVPLDGLDPAVSAAFGRALERLSAAGAVIVEQAFPALDLVQEIARHGGLVDAEAYAWHRDLLARNGGSYDPRVRQRMMTGSDRLAADYLAALAARTRAVAAFDRETPAFDAILCPTVAVVPPRFDEVATDASFFAVNGRVLRNTAVFNMLDRCALSLPCSEPAALPVGLMVVGERGGDRRLLAVGMAIEAALAASI